VRTYAPPLYVTAPGVHTSERLGLTRCSGLVYVKIQCKYAYVATLKRHAAILWDVHSQGVVLVMRDLTDPSVSGVQN